MREPPDSPKLTVPTVQWGARQSVVFDTITLVSVCLFPNRRPARALRVAVTEHDVCCSKETLAELVAVLSREKFERWRPEAERAKFIEEFLRVITLVAITKIGAGCRDATDNMFLSLALSANASIIVSSDPDLLVMSPYEGIAIVDPNGFLERFDATPNVAVALRIGAAKGQFAVPDSIEKTNADIAAMFEANDVSERKKP